MSKELAKTYDPHGIEEKLYQKWLEKKYFHAEVDHSKKPFTIVMPPPNITGQLHMGHALDNTMQDILIRFKRMQGYNALWQPGTDHASIATEVKIIEKMKEEGIDKEDLGREGFLERAWDWKREYGGRIIEQLKKLGSSCDWDRERFTMDEGCNKAVTEVFCKMHEKGWIYKGSRIINWCPVCNTSISDAEVEYEEQAGHFWHIKYPIIGTDEFLTFATTRPETMLGDTAVAINPNDDRYKHLSGKKVMLPLMNRELPIVEDTYVDMEFGTGVVKITPAHDPNDFEVGKRHNLPEINIMNDDATINENGGKFAGMDRYEARKAIVKELDEMGLLVKIEDHVHNVGTHDRCKTTIEPMIKKQWFVKMDELIKPAAEAVRTGDIQLIPERMNKTYYNWTDNIKDWCISRQLWWGHRIPAYYCEDCGEIHVGKEIPEKCTKCGCTKFVQDPDSLDTWFSSALWPFSTLGWPNEESEDYKDFYPTQTLVTGFDIITFWVSRMMTQGLEFTNQVPFKDILIHGIVRDSQGRKMSKTLGNGVDPLEVIDQYGTDSLRFSLLSGTTMGNDIRFMPEKLDQAANFANKVWNAAKFITMNLADDDKVRDFCYEVYEKNSAYNPDLLRIEDKWILNKFDKLVQDVSKNIDNYDLGIAVDKIYGFMWNEFCDWYIEMVKPRIYSENEEERVAVSDILNHVFGSSLKLLHPFMPFVTSEIYSKLICFGTEDIMVSKWPTIREEFVFDNEESIIEKLKKLIVEIRNIRTKMNVHPTKKSKLLIVSNSIENEIKEAEEFLLKLGFANEIVIVKDEKEVPQNAVSIIVDELKVFIPFEELVDIEEERKRLEGEKSKLEAEVLRGEKMLSNPGFVNKAPEAKVNEEKAKLENYKQMLQNVEERLASLK